MSPSGVDVFLNVYDLVQGNNLAHHAGFGIYHSGVEIRGVEYSFGYCPSGSGVYHCVPRSVEGAVFREAVFMGQTTKSSREIERILDKMRDEYPGPSYHMLTRNCNAFSSDFLFRVMGKPAPRWVNRAAGVGGLVSSFLPASWTGMQGSMPQATSSSSSGGRGTQQPIPQRPSGGGGSHLRGAAASAPLPHRQNSSSSTSSGGGGGSSSPQTKQLSEEERQKLREARLKYFESQQRK